MLKEPIFQIQIFFFACVFGGIIFAVWYSLKKNKERKKQKTEFENNLLTSFENEAISSPDDLLHYHKAHFERSIPKVRRYRDLYLFLEKMQFRISSSRPPDSAYKLKDKLVALREIIETLNESLSAEERRVPFYGTPEQERDLLEDILELTTADRDIVNSKLSRLAELIRVRQDTVNTLGEEKGKARKLAAWGLTGTIIFGVLSVILKIWGS